MSYQPEGAKDGETLNIGETQFDETEDDDDDVETVPLVLQVLEQTQGKDLEGGLCREDRRKHLPKSVVRTL